MRLRDGLAGLLTAVMVWALPAEDLFAQEPGEGADNRVDAASTQILLDQANFSPGSIDNGWGSSTSRTRRALAAFQQAKGLRATGRVDRSTLRALVEAAGGKELYVAYQLQPEDVNGPFYDIPTGDWKAMSQIESMGYTSALELLGEKFHCSPHYLQTLNPQAAFQAGEAIWVPNVEPFRIPTPEDARKVHNGSSDVTEVIVSEADKSITLKRGEEIVYWAPVTPGSEKLPMPSGIVEVQAFDVNPVYWFSPDVIREAKVKEKLKIPPGPNSPVGVVWVDLSAERYGLHGTPEPEKITYTSSHGCIRLTNWDAVEVAKLVKRGTQIQFIRKSPPAAEATGFPGETDTIPGLPPPVAQ